MASLQQIPVRKLGGGVNDFNASDGITDAEMQATSRNARGDAEFCTQRKGYVTVFDTKTGNSHGIRNISPYYRKLDANDRLFMAYGTNIYLVDPANDASWTALTQSFITSSVTIETVSYFDWLFVFNGVDKPLKIEGTTVTQPFTKPDSIASANDFIPSYGDIYQGHLFVAGVPTAPNSVFISKVAAVGSEADIYDFSGTIATGTVDANEIVLDNRVTAMRKLSNAVVMFTIDGAWYCSGFQEVQNGVEPIRQPIPGASGAVSQKASVVVNGDIYYMTPNKEIRSIKRSLANSEAFDAIPLSRKVQRFLNTEIDDDLSSVFAFYDSAAREVHFYLRKKGDASNTIRLVGDMDKVDETGSPAWYIDDNMPFFSGCFYKGKRYVGSSALGQVYEDDNGNADDDDVPIVFKRVSKDYTLNDPLLLKNWKGVDITGDITQTTELTASVYVDDVLVDSKTISIENQPSNALISGIGTEETGDFEIGDEGEDPTPNATDLYPFFTRIPIRRRGKKCTVVIDAQGANNTFRITNMVLYAIATPARQYSLSERQ